jgi:hypothetical protein
MRVEPFIRAWAVVAPGAVPVMSGLFTGSIFLADG